METKHQVHNLIILDESGSMDIPVMLVLRHIWGHTNI
jgi:hypothetical protein